MSKWEEQLNSFSRESVICTMKQLQLHMHGLKPVTNTGPLQSNILFLRLALHLNRLVFKSIINWPHPRLIMKDFPAYGQMVIEPDF